GTPRSAVFSEEEGAGTWLFSISIGFGLATPWAETVEVGISGLTTCSDGVRTSVSAICPEEEGCNKCAYTLTSSVYFCIYTSGSAGPSSAVHFVTSGALGATSSSGWKPTLGSKSSVSTHSEL
ncbi:hypothetical protein Dimus_026880, partial [Dionaea muscipula]